MSLLALAYTPEEGPLRPYVGSDPQSTYHSLEDWIINLGLIESTSHCLGDWSEPAEGSSFMSLLALACTPAVNLQKDPYLGSDAQSTSHCLEDWSEPAEGS